MDLFTQIEDLETLIDQLQTELAALREQKAKTQDPGLRKAIQTAITAQIDNIDEANQALDLLKARLPQKRTNGHHPPESEEDLELPINPNVSEDTEPPSDN